jgi:adenylate cyclase, class 2
MIRSHPLYPTELRARGRLHYTVRQSEALEYETEVKIPLRDSATIHQRLLSIGFAISAPRVFEANTVYDTADSSLRQGEMLLRLRQSGSRGILTWKGPGVPGPHKSRPELETAVASLETLDKILRQLGYLPGFRYEKYRTEFESPETQSGTITFDETPIGEFLELEGSGDWIDSSARQLGFSPGDYVLSSYGKLYLDYCAQRGLQPGNMVFASPG